MSLLDVAKKELWTIAHELIYFASYIIPKNKNIWVFGAWRGQLYSDNSKYIYEYVNKYHKEIKAVWITKNHCVFTELNAAGLRCYYYQSPLGIWTSLRAKVVFTTSGLVDVAEWAHGRVLHIQLWHGTPLKKIGYDNVGWDKIFTKSIIQRFKNVLLPYVERSPKNDLFMVSSEEVKSKFQSAFRVSASNIFVTGQPRNDSFVIKPVNPYFEYIKKQYPEYKIICYLPTHRNFGSNNNSPFTPEVLAQTDKYLHKHNIILIFKPHFHELKNFINMKDEYNNIIMGVDEQVFSDIYSYLHYCDLLISDYSSVFIDYMCSGKPIVFYPYDLNEYIANDADLYYDYTKVTPGVACNNWPDVLESAVISLNSNKVNEKYNHLFRYFNTYNDGNNSARVFEIVNQKVYNCIKKNV